MTRLLKWMAVAVLTLLVLLVIAAFALQRWIGTEDFRARAGREASAALGVPVTLGALQVDLWPLPAVAVQDVRLQTRPALSVERVEVRPALAALLQGRLDIATVIVRRAVLPQPAIDSLLAALQKKQQETSKGRGLQPDSTSNSGAGMAFMPRRVVLDDVTWLNAQGQGMTLDADARIDADGLPGQVSLKVTKGRLHGAHAALQRSANSWSVKLDVGGGTVQGDLKLVPAPRPGEAMSVSGKFDTKGVEIAALAPPDVAGKAGRGHLTGRLDATTTLTSRAATPGALAQALQTQSSFNVRDAVVHGIDLARAVKTVGLSRGGETRLDTLAGQVVSQGLAVQLNQLVASSGALTASGHVAIAPNRALSGQVNVDLAQRALGSAVGVPLVVGGTLDAPEVTLTRGAMLGAAIGTAMMPGVGTGAGAKLGDKLGKLFGR